MFSWNHTTSFENCGKSLTWLFKAVVLNRSNSCLILSKIALINISSQSEHEWYNQIFNQEKDEFSLCQPVFLRRSDNLFARLHLVFVTRHHFQLVECKKKISITFGFTPKCKKEIQIMTPTKNYSLKDKYTRDEQKGICWCKILLEALYSFLL